MTSPETYERKARSQLAAAALELLDVIHETVPPERREAAVDAVHKLVQLTRVHERLAILVRACEAEDSEPEMEDEPEPEQEDDDARRLAHIRQIADGLEAAYQR